MLVAIIFAIGVFGMIMHQKESKINFGMIIAYVFLIACLTHSTKIPILKYFPLLLGILMLTGLLQDAAKKIKHTEIVKKTDFGSCAFATIVDNGEVFLVIEVKSQTEGYQKTDIEKLSEDLRGVLTVVSNEMKDESKIFLKIIS